MSSSNYVVDDVNDSISIPIPRGAVRMNLTSEDMIPNLAGKDSSASPIDDSTAGKSRVKMHESYFASVHIPNFVYWARVFSPDSFPELTVVSPKQTPNNTPANSANSTRNNTNNTKSSDT